MKQTKYQEKGKVKVPHFFIGLLVQNTFSPPYKYSRAMQNVRTQKYLLRLNALYCYSDTNWNVSTNLTKLPKIILNFKSPFMLLDFLHANK
jgi:hypothetical protein